MRLKQSHVALTRTNAQTDLRRAWLSRREILTFRNARAHIRIFLSASQDQPHDAEEAQ